MICPQTPDRLLARVAVHVRLGDRQRLAGDLRRPARRSSAGARPPAARPRAWRASTGLPLSSDSSSASSSAFASIASASASIARVRSAAAMPLQRPSSKASRAARTARSTSSAPRLRHLGDRPAGGGVERLERAPVGRLGPLAADQQPVRARGERAGGVGEGVGQGGGGGHAAGCYGEPQLDAAQLVELEPHAYRPAAAMCGGASDAGDDALTRAQLLAGASSRRRDRLDHLLEVRAGLARRHACSLLAVHADARARRARAVSTRGPKATARWKMLPARIVSRSWSRSGGSASSSAGSSATIERAVLAQLDGHLGLDHERAVVRARLGAVLEQVAVVRKPASGLVDAELLLEGRDVEARSSSRSARAPCARISRRRVEQSAARRRAPRSRRHHDLERLAAVVDGVGLGRVGERHVVGDERRRVEHAGGHHREHAVHVADHVGVAGAAA